MQQGSYHMLGPEGAETESTNTRLYMSHTKSQAPAGGLYEQRVKATLRYAFLKGRTQDNH